MEVHYYSDTKEKWTHHSGSSLGSCFKNLPGN